VPELERRGLSPTLIVRERLAHAEHTVVVLDLKAPPRATPSFRFVGEPDTLIHLAWGGLPNYKSTHHVDEELPSQFRFLEGLIKDGLKNLLVAGTCLEYGLQSGALTEDLETAPTTQYGIAKDSLRKQLEALKSSVPFRLTWARLFYSYGEGQSPNSILPQLTSAVARGDKTFNMSGGEQLRDYLPVTEVARLLVALATNGRDNGIVNVCSGQPISVRALVERWLEENGWSIALGLGHYPYPEYEPMAFWGDRRKLDRCLAT